MVDWDSRLDRLSTDYSDVKRDHLTLASSVFVLVTQVQDIRDAMITNDERMNKRFDSITDKFDNVGDKLDALVEGRATSVAQTAALSARVADIEKWRDERDKDIEIRIVALANTEHRLSSQEKKMSGIYKLAFSAAGALGAGLLGAFVKYWSVILAWLLAPKP